MSRQTIIAKRVDSGSADVDEIRALADAAGYDVVETLTQSRSEDSTYQFGEGKATELASRVAETDADAVVFDNELSPQQTYHLQETCPDGTEVRDRFRLILKIFDQQARTKESQLQVELATLRYELPRVEAELRLERDIANERRGRGGLGEREDRRITDIRQRIDRIEATLDGLDDRGEQRRHRRREAGFEFVALAGYTNAGKSTLLQRLADGLAFGENEERHADLVGTAEAEDRPFKTLGTTTRRATVAGRSLMLSDTVGFVRDLPHWLVESFESTIEEVYRADLVLLVVDVSDPTEEIREKLATSRDLLDGEIDGKILTVLNQRDLVTDRELAAKREAIADLAPDAVAVSATEGIGLGALRERIGAELPELERERLDLPNGDEAMGLVSWLYDRARVGNVSYEHGGDRVAVEFEAQPRIVERARSKADSLAGERLESR